MIATIRGSPSAPARAKDGGLPPTPSQIGQRILHWSGIDALSRQGGPVLPGPVDVLVLPDVEEQIELLGEERVIVVQLEPEQGKRLDERTPAHHHLRPALRQQVERGELLEHPHRVGRAQDRDGTGQANLAGA